MVVGTVAPATAPATAPAPGTDDVGGGPTTVPPVRASAATFFVATGR
jgi:hypothetical protein